MHGDRGSPLLADLVGANSAEFDADSPYPVIATMDDQVAVVSGDRDMGGTMRLGLYPAELTSGSLVHGPTASPRSRNATGIVTRSTTPTETSSRLLG